MKRIALMALLLIVLAGLTAAQQKAAQGQQGQTAPAASAPAQPQQAAPAGKTLPQAKTQDEFKAYQEAAQLQDPVALEAAANNFSEKFKNSELRYLLYYRTMFGYQSQNNAEKAIEMGRKVLSLNPNEPATLAMVAVMLAERTRESDLDRDERLNESMQDAQKALEKVDTDLLAPPGTPQERIDQTKKTVRSTAYSALGTACLVKSNYAEAEKNLKQSIDLGADNPDAITILRYAIALDQQKKYSEALVATNKALDLSPAGSPQLEMVKQERERLLKLTSAPAPAQPQVAPPK